MTQLPKPTAQTSTFEITTSPEFTGWLFKHHLSLAFTTYQTNRLFFISCQTNGRLKFHERLFDKPMGLYADGERLYMGTRYQLWQFENLLEMGEKYGECDRLYIPRTAHTTGDLNVHDVVLDHAHNIVFVNTDFSCLATLDPKYSFVPLWQPPFISKLVPEDRCHLNGLAMVEGKPTYMTACSATDTATGWRNHRRDGGVVIDVEQNEIIATGLSMPHSPRWYKEKLWLLNSGTGELGYIENGKFTPITFCPGFVRGLAFWGDFAVVGLSKLRSKPFTGLALEERLKAQGNTAHCGVMVIDLNSGQIVEWVHIAKTVEELFDIVILPNVRQPEALGLQGDEVQRLVTFPNSGGIVTTKPTVKRPSIGQAAPVAGLPQEVQGQQPKLSVKYQRVYHLNSSNALDYNDLTYPSLKQRWQTQPPQGELFGISASVEGSMVGFAIAERVSVETAELISLLVLPQCRRQGIGTKLLVYLEQELKQQGTQQLSLTYESSTLSRLALEPILQKLGWHLPSTIGDRRQSHKFLGADHSAPPEATPRISLVMTVYNTEAYLAEALDSVLAQTYRDWELILWDDGSSDNSITIAESYAQRDPRIRFHSGPRLGRVKALKEAHCLTQGEYVGWIDADDRLASEALAQTLAWLEQHPDYGIVYTNYIDMDSQGNLKDLGYRCQIPYRPHRLLLDLVTFHFRLFRRSLFEAVGGINPEMESAEDYDVCLKLEEVSKIHHLQQPLYFYRINPESITQKQTALQQHWSQWAVNQALKRRGLAQTYNLVSDPATGKFSLQRRDGVSISQTAQSQLTAGKKMATQGNLAGAVECFNEAIRLQPDYSAAYNQLGKAYQQLGQTDEAIATYEHLLSINPHLPQAHCNLGAIWQIQGKTEAALEAYKKAIELKPDFALAHLNLGKLYSQRGEWQAAESALQAVIRLQPDSVEAYQTLAHLHEQQGNISKAIATWETALNTQPQLIEAWNSLGCLWMNQGEMRKAQGCFEKVIALNPDFPRIDRNLGEVLKKQGKFSEALSCYSRALENNPEDTEVFYQREHLRLILCDWQGYEQRMETLQHRLQQHLQTDTSVPLSPLSINCFRVPIDNHQAVTRHWGQFVGRSIEPIKPHCQFAPPPPPAPKLRLGYLSADFREHAVGTLIHQLFSYHDSSAFEVYGYSLHQKSDQFTDIIRAGVDHFRDFSVVPTQQAAQQIHDDGIHILIDLMGYTTFSRPQILALQPAPIQIQYLGYPNTMGVDFIQYILADSWLIPPESEGFYTEEVVRLPHAFVGSAFKISAQPLTRADFGLPTESFVFCCFNRTDKFDPEIFRTWMRILARVPDSVLWLIETRPQVNQTLRHNAQTLGIAPERLIFTSRLPFEQYLKAYTLADLFLDTWIYNAGATAIHALWAGLPLITSPGQPFVARMGASLCAATGLEFLICDCLAAYEEKAVYLASHPNELATIRQELAQNRHSLPLFQPQQWVRNLEALCWRLWGKFHRESGDFVP